MKLSIAERARDVRHRIAEIIAESEAEPDGVAWSAWADAEVDKVLRVAFLGAMRSGVEGHLRAALTLIVLESTDHADARAIAAAALGYADDNPGEEEAP